MCYTDCFNTPERIRQELPTADILRILHEIQAAGCLEVTFTGGEPLCRPDFMEIYETAHRFGFLITVFSNGTLITREIADQWARMPPVRVEISLHAISDAVCAKLQLRPLNVEAVRLLMERQIPVTLKTVGTTLNRDEILAIKRYVDDFGPGVSFQFGEHLLDDLTGSGAPLRFQLSDKDLAAIERQDPQLWAERERDGHATYPDDFPCQGGRYKFHIDAYGQLQLCSNNRRASYDLRRGSFLEGFYKALPSFPCPRKKSLAAADPIPSKSIHLMEDHETAYTLWKDAGVQGRTLIHLDGHLDFFWIDDHPPHKAMDSGNFLYPAIREGFIRELYWVIPDGFWETPDQRQKLIQWINEMIHARPDSAGPLRVSETGIHLLLMGCPLTVCRLESLPRFIKPVLLDIDVDYLLTRHIDGTGLFPYFDSDYAGPWLQPSHFLRRLRAVELPTDFVTLSYSVNKGYTPLRYKYFGDLIQRALLDPAALVEDQPPAGSAARVYEQVCEALGRNDVPSAREAWERMISLDPSYRTLYATPAYKEEFLKQWEPALREYERLMELDPEWPAARQNWNSIIQNLKKSGGTIMAASTEQLDFRFQKCPTMVARRVAGEMVLVPANRQPNQEPSLYTLNEVGAFLWEQIDGRRTGRELTALLGKAFTVDSAVAEQDVATYLSELRAIGAVQTI
jgi:hypothetical protein